MKAERALLCKSWVRYNKNVTYKMMIKNIYSEKQKGIKRYFFNTSWLMVEKVGRMGLGLIVTVWLARYLGPKQFGLFNYAYSFVMLFSVLQSLGLEKLLAREFINYPEEESQIMGSAIILQFFGGIALFLCASIVAYFSKAGDMLTFHLVVVMSSAYLFKALSTIRCWYEAHVKAKVSSAICLSAFVLSMLLKVIMILTNAPLIAFAWAIFSESVFLALGLYYLYYIRDKHTICFKVNWKKTGYLLAEAWPLILAGGLYTIYTRIDQIMLGQFLGDEAVGVYSAAIKISEGWSFIPVIIVASLFPALLRARKKDTTMYTVRIQQLLNLMILISFFVAASVTLFSHSLISLLFGKEYVLSSTVLSIHIWGGSFIAMSAVSFRVFLAEGLQKYSFYRGLTGLITNVFLNYLMIPKYGVTGAAVATVISQATSLYLFNAISPQTRFVFIMQSKAFVLTGFFKNIIKLVKV